MKQKPKLIIPLELRHDSRLKDFLEQTDAEHGVGRVIQAQDGQLAGIMFDKKTGELKISTGGPWQVLASIGALATAETALSTTDIEGANSRLFTVPVTMDHLLTLLAGANVTGNIAVSGTVDAVDVSAHDHSGANQGGTITAGSIVYVPYSHIGAVDIQNAINEVVAEKLALTGGTLTGTLNARDILPSASATYGLGSALFKWQTLYVNSTAYIGNLILSWGQITPDVDGDADLGTTLLRWKDLFLSGNIAIAGTVDTIDVAAHTHSAAAGHGVSIPESSVISLVNDLALKAPLASPSFTGTVTGGESGSEFILKSNYAQSNWTTGAFVLQPNSATPNLIFQVKNQAGTEQISLDRYGAFRFIGRFSYNSLVNCHHYSLWPSGKASSTWNIGCPIYVSGANTVSLARADVEATCDAIALNNTDEASPTTSAQLCTMGYLSATAAQWDDVTDEADVTGLTPGATYYVSPTNAGQITKTRPSTAGQFIKRIGVAKSATVMWVDCGGAPIAV